MGEAGASWEDGLNKETGGAGANTEIYRCRHTHDRAQEITVCLAQ